MKRLSGGFEARSSRRRRRARARIVGSAISRLPRIRRPSPAISSGSPGRGHPGQLQRVVVVAGDHVEVEVEDRLPGGGAAGVEDVEAVGLERLLHPRGEAAGGERCVRLEVLVGDLEQVRRVRRAGSPARGPRVAGLMSMNATVCSSESTISPGTSPATIPQKRQSRSAIAAADLPERSRASATASSRSPPRRRTPPPRSRPAAGRARARARSRARAASSSPEIGDRGGPSRCHATASGSTSRASSRCASIISGVAVGPLPRAASRSATVSRVTSAATGAVGAGSRTAAGAAAAARGP